MRHSSDFYMHELGAITVCFCEMMLKRESLDNAEDISKGIMSGLTGIMLIVIAQCMDGHRCSSTVKVSVYIGCLGMALWRNISIEIGEHSEFYVSLPFMTKPLSVLKLMRVALLNNMVLFFKKLVFQIKHKNCILIGMHPQIVWLNDGIREKLTLSLTQSIERSVTMSFDIHKQSLQQQIDVFLDNNRDISRLCLRHRVARKFSAVEFAYFLIFHFFIFFAFLID